jgi:hypothetical protein
MSQYKKYYLHLLMSAAWFLSPFPKPLPLSWWVHCLFVWSICSLLQTVVVTQNQVSCRQVEYFNNPNKFQPERWIKDHPSYKQVNPYLVLPFGHGPRTCIARRLAEQNMHTLILKVSMLLSHWQRLMFYELLRVQKHYVLEKFLTTLYRTKFY